MKEFSGAIRETFRHLGRDMREKVEGALSRAVRGYAPIAAGG